jgi:hypothetical protein
VLPRVERDALHTVLANLGGLLEHVLPLTDIDDLHPRSDELWPTESEYQRDEAQHAEDRSTLKAALICFALANAAQKIRGEGERLVALMEEQLHDPERRI